MMERLDHDISELLFEHDCVVVPKFGGFVGNRVPSQFDKVQHRFSPPYKAITFNKNLINNDGLLANQVANQREISYTEANYKIEEFVTFLNLELKDKKKVDIEGVGLLYLDNTSKLLFEPQQRVNYLQDAFGLSAVYGLPVKQEAAEPITQKLEAPEKNEKVAQPTLREKVKEAPPSERIVKEQPIRKKRVVVPLAAVLIPLILLYVGWFSYQEAVIYEQVDFTYSDLNPFAGHIDVNYDARESEPIKVDDFNIERGATDLLGMEEITDFILMPLFDVADPEFDEQKKIVVRIRDEVSVAATTEVKDQVNKVPEELRFHVIGGCFSMKDNAINYVSKLVKLGYQSAILDKRGSLYRVTIQSYATRAEALRALPGIRELANKDAWLLVK